MKIYLDNVSTTSLNSEVLDTYKKLLDEYYCNSDALYDDGVAIYNMQEKARSNILETLGVKNSELIFTSGASEANSLAIKGYALKHNDKKHLITSIYEHSSTYNSFKQLENEFGYEVTYLKPNDKGVIDLDELEKAIKPNTSLVSIMMVNNEIGVINDIDAIGKIVKKHSGVIFHSDVTQALGKIDIDFTNVDMASFSAHKLHGLKGSGALIKKEHIELLPLISGGQQEYSIRGGTSNALTNIVLAKTVRLAIENMHRNNDYINELNNYFYNELRDIVKINSFKEGLKTLFNISTSIKSEVLLNALNEKGIMVSSKSTCGSRKNELNRSLSSINVDEDYALRVSFDYYNTLDELKYFISSLKEILDKYG